ncbi:MAG TPA: radical SAM protein [Candidatus Brocadiia bacterium]|nr:radical SAM protein [Candidatus Brocadiia bacterium]
MNRARQDIGGLLRLRLSPDALGGVLIFVTDRCNARCAPCFYWRNLENPAPEMGIEDYRRMAGGLGKVHKLMLSGGEPFLRDDLADVAGALMRGSGASRMDIATNGTLPERIFDTARILCASFPDREFSISVSVDGPRDIHNRIRGADCHNTAIESLDRLIKLSDETPNLLPGAILTLSRLNEASAIATLMELRKNGVPHVEVSVARGTGRGDDQLAPDPETTGEVFAFLNCEGRSRWQSGSGAALARYRRKTQLALLEGRTVRLKCCAARRFVAVMPSADVFPCPGFSERLGNLRESGWDMRAILESGKAGRIRDQIRAGACKCTLECAMDWSVFYDWRADAAVIGGA